MLGMSMIGSSLNFTPFILTGMNDIQVQNANYDVVRVDSSITDDATTIDRDWNSTTHICADFFDSLYGGNSSLGVDNVSNILIKRRENGTFEWFNMFDVAIEDVDDFNFNLEDRYLRLSTSYQYAIVPIINGLEGEYSFAETSSGEQTISVDYGGIIILDASTEYESIMNVSYSEEINHSKTDLNTMDLAFPITVTNGMNKYYTGSVSAMFAKWNDNVLDTENTPDYIKKLVSFLANDNKKIIKYRDGTIRMCDVIGNVSIDNSEHKDIYTVSFEFTEKGNLEDNSDMYWNGFLDISEAWW